MMCERLVSECFAQCEGAALVALLEGLCRSVPPLRVRVVFAVVIRNFRPELDGVLDTIFSRIAVPFTESETAFLVALLERGPSRVFDLLDVVPRAPDQHHFRPPEAVFFARAFSKRSDIVSPNALQRTTEILFQNSADWIPAACRREIAICTRALLEQHYMNSLTEDAEVRRPFVIMFVLIHDALPEDMRADLMRWVVRATQTNFPLSLLFVREFIALYEVYFDPVWTGVRPHRGRPLADSFSISLYHGTNNLPMKVVAKLRIHAVLLQIGIKFRICPSSVHLYYRGALVSPALTIGALNLAAGDILRIAVDHELSADNPPYLLALLSINERFLMFWPRTVPQRSARLQKTCSIACPRTRIISGLARTNAWPWHCCRPRTVPRSRNTLMRLWQKSWFIMISKWSATSYGSELRAATSPITVWRSQLPFEASTFLTIRFSMLLRTDFLTRR
jgi:hypothetical protein